MDHQLISAGLARETIWQRQCGTCLACHRGMLQDAMHAHHRMRRRDLGWCPCNVVGLHSDCHVIAPGAVHQRVEWARERGLIVPTYDDPRIIPVTHVVPWHGELYLTCDGLVQSDLPEGLNR